jgi:hypothetical protein
VRLTKSGRKRATNFPMKVCNLRSIFATREVSHPSFFSFRSFFKFCQ